MSSRAALLGLCIFLRLGGGLAFPAWGSDWADFVSAGDRTRNPLAIQALVNADSETALETAQALGRRTDPFIGDILDALAGRFNGAGDYRREHLLRVLIVSFFGEAVPAAESARRVKENRTQVDRLIRGLNGIRDPQLASAVVRLIPLARDEKYGGELMSEGARLVQEMRRGGGELSPMKVELLLAVISAVRATGSEDFLQLCTSIESSSRDPRAVAAAREAAAAIASAAP